MEAEAGEAEMSAKESRENVLVVFQEWGQKRSNRRRRNRKKMETLERVEEEGEKSK